MSLILTLLLRFMAGDLIWSMPIVLAGCLSIIPAVFPRRRWVRFTLFMVLFLFLSLSLHLLLDAPIHALQAWWTTPLGPPLNLK
jgi:hypothetical protein